MILEGNLFYKEKNDKWILTTDKKDIKVNSLIYGLADLGLEFEGDGEFVELSINISN